MKQLENIRPAGQAIQGNAIGWLALLIATGLFLATVNLDMRKR